MLLVVVQLLGLVLSRHGNGHLRTCLVQIVHDNGTLSLLFQVGQLILDLLRQSLPDEFDLARSLLGQDSNSFLIFLWTAINLCRLSILS